MPWRALLAVALHGAAVAAPLPVLLFRRREIAVELNLIGAIESEAGLIGAVAVIAALAVPRLRGRVSAHVTLIAGAILSVAGLLIMTTASSGSSFLLGGILLAVGIGPALVLHRILLSVRPTRAGEFRTMALYWAAVSFGALWPLGLQIFGDISYQTILQIATVAMGVAAAILVAASDLDETDGPVPGRTRADTSELLDVPWARRSLAAAFAGGATVVGGADAAQALLVNEWQRSPVQTAAVLAAGATAAFLISLLGPWYHRLARLSGGRRADAIGLQLLVAGALVVVGGLSFTYIGLVVSWAVAGGALALAATGLDAAVFPAFSAAQRRVLAARQVAAAGVGGAIGAAWNGWIIGSWSDQWKIALTGVPLIVVGFAVRRYADSARARAVESSTAVETTVPRRVAGLDGEPTPVLSVEHLDVAYGAVQVLFDVTLQVRPGQVVALLGTNGAGKTTLLRAVSGLEPTMGGRVVFAGLDITKTRPTWRVGMGLQQVVGGDAVVAALTVEENLRLFGHSLPPSEREAGIEDCLPHLPTTPVNAPTSEQQPCPGARSRCSRSPKRSWCSPSFCSSTNSPSGLAPKVVSELLPVISRIAADGAAVLIVEQSVRTALSIADHAYVMEKGEIGFHGAADELQAQPDLLQAAYLHGLAKAIEG